MVTFNRFIDSKLFVYMYSLGNHGSKPLCVGFVANLLNRVLYKETNLWEILDLPDDFRGNDFTKTLNELKRLSS